MKRILIAFVSLGLAALLILGGVNIVKASPSYDQEVTETAKLFQRDSMGRYHLKGLMHQGLPNIFLEQM
ncbi:hypothetical protein [Fictibacillus phosphorivorans]|uniref:hypothetical protein n=1 Tax=Fictibacillus phosphorivorans TaxID=1221500 RepID=UPI0020403C79|nr:hypothetical protein [Fictibacillus phosphorivorans]MCM3719414.1 hypothetical protein [Fictibacillus phosphorivorans]MCM3777108.1 hypothetical protein [Fictibacillus phosphorivorans]